MGLKSFIIPAVDIKDGKAVRLFKGDPDAVTVYGDNPVEIAKQWEEKGAKHLHIVDLDGAFEGKPKNYKIVQQIVKEISIPVEFGGGLRSFEAVKAMINIGVERVVIGSLAYQNEKEFLKIVNAFPEKVIVGIDAKDGKVAIKGWLEKTEFTPLEFAKRFDELDIWGFLYTDVNRDGAMVGPNVEGTKYLAQNLKHPVIASGGVGSIEDVKKLYQLKEFGVYGVVVGKALYEGKIKLEELED
ncbi:1-(5-phosphoribosyl)-5-[(5-phosphoribosylamino)methylideneamino] imidazole-4-carboxamide isomerase [Persephonella hydrogeniphila]|uniref:1-(5-phosphoribosyl)-5-[(5-phosphoribosylamino)methylideneamino] imidazole-4-carboxamide isomerase n=1 Tax=Persephonella hydrogeniphila TaxID=198703 RepID=A0A285NKE1_9AQUI|nr:1-(5-phosphoribosyl)-5-[(5-phosphoribosylamino)methylideneamino]imidazole-4-carboxamide isomerase [Persephonella hydrogeniphila]SNZ09403.1 1-(5-phosphoribosyl)-5-[(5-phosphoribosylamino)methylideneamino] imidazole-4-carboxamide isomerase [Persephonella hydrogeniphila]